MANTLIKVVHTETIDWLAQPSVHGELNKLSEWFASLACGARMGSVKVSVAEVTGAQATGTCTITSGSGSETATINGVAIAVTWATSDANTASLLAAAINGSANALVAGIVTASAASNVVTITSVDKSITANAITLAASGTGNVASGARLTGGVAPVYTTYDRS